MDADKLCLDRHARNHKIGLINQTVALAGCNLILRTEHETCEDNAIKSLQRIIYDLFYLSINELSLTYLEIRRCRVTEFGCF